MQELFLWEYKVYPLAKDESHPFVIATRTVVRSPNKELNVVKYTLLFDPDCLRYGFGTDYTRGKKPYNEEFNEKLQVASDLIEIITKSKYQVSVFE